MALAVAVLPAPISGGMRAGQRNYLRQAPPWMQKRGLEWSFRLVMEPGRLWRRYAQAVPQFMLLFARQLLAMRFTSLPDSVCELAPRSIDGGTLQ